MVANVDDEGVRDVVNVVPVAIPGGLEAGDMVGDEDGEGGHVSVRWDPQRQVRARARWVIIYLEKVFQFVPSSCFP